MTRFTCRITQIHTHNFTFMWPCTETNFLIIKPTRCTNLLKFILEWNSTCFGQFLCPSSGVIHCTLSNGKCHTDSWPAAVYKLVWLVWRPSCRAAGSGSNSVPSCCCCSTAVYKLVWHIPLLSLQWITPDDGQRNCSKLVEFRFQNKFEKLVHLVGFIIRKEHTHNIFLSTVTTARRSSVSVTSRLHCPL
jgi:hypothetical protein